MSSFSRNAVVDIISTNVTTRVSNLLIPTTKTTEDVKILIASHIPAGFMISRVKLDSVTFTPVWKVYILEIPRQQTVFTPTPGPVVVTQQPITRSQSVVVTPTPVVVTKTVTPAPVVVTRTVTPAPVVVTKTVTPAPVVVTRTVTSAPVVPASTAVLVGGPRRIDDDEQIGGRKKRSGSKKAGSKKAGSKKTGSKKTGSKRAGSKKTGSKKTGSKRAGSKKTGSKKTGSKNATTKKTGSKKTGSKKAGSKKTGSKRTEPKLAVMIGGVRKGSKRGSKGSKQ